MAQHSKRDQIVNVAGDLFVEHGFRKVSIDQIARAVPVSKPTLYAHFKDKRELFSAVISQRCARMLETLKASVDAGQSVQETLTSIGFEFLQAVLSDQSLNMHRTLAAEAHDFPEIAALFYDSGPRQLHGFLSNYLQKLDEKKTLRVPDATLSADMFISMIKGNIHLQRLLGVAKHPSKKHMRARVEYAVALFLTAHHAQG